MTEQAGKATKAVILVRVSTREQEEGYSIEAQKYRLEEYQTSFETSDLTISQEVW